MVCSISDLRSRLSEYRIRSADLDLQVSPQLNADFLVLLVDLAKELEFHPIRLSHYDRGWTLYPPDYNPEACNMDVLMKSARQS